MIPPMTPVLNGWTIPLSVKKLKKISNPPLVSYLANEPNFWVIKLAFLYDFDNTKKDTKKQR
jgi:hypothetical protein